MPVFGDLRPGTRDDAPWMSDLNNANTPAVSPIDPPGMAELVAQAAAVFALDGDDFPRAGFAAVMTDRSVYDSDNFAWFCDRFDSFAYIDRIVIDGTVRRAGLGRALYAQVDQWAHNHGLTRVTCEVNEDPPNPASLAFHGALGFQPVGRRTSNAGKRVVMLVKPVPPA